MTVKVVSAPIQTSSALRWLRRGLLVIALVSFGTLGYVYLESTRYQAEQDRALDEPVSAASTKSAGKSGRVDSQIGSSDLIGRISIPRLKVRSIVEEGTESATLRHAVGHVEGTALPGEVGNVGLAGHRDSFFRGLKDIARDDRIKVETRERAYEYRVDSLAIVGPDDVSVLDASGGKTLTLVTCYPFGYVGNAPRRFIVHATQISSTSRQAAVKRRKPRGS